MTGGVAEPVASVADQLAQLSDLFRRRLLEDRNQRQLLVEQQARIEKLESELNGDRLVPLLRGLRLVVDRARSLEDEQGFGESIAEEILEALTAFGIDPITDLGPLDPARHEVVGTTAKTESPIVARIVSVGFAKNGRTLIPALVAVSDPQ